MTAFGVEPYGQPKYLEIAGKRMAYIDEGKGDAIVFQHGNPTSSYLWRNIMPHLEGLGRLVACDLIGMGASDKLSPSGPDRYSYGEQRDFLFALWDALDLGDHVVLVLHDWGSALGFDWANQHRDRVQGIAFMEAIVTPMTWAGLAAGRAGCVPGFPIASRRANGVGAQHLCRTGAARGDPATAQRRGNEPLSAAIRERRRGPSPHVVVATKPSNRR